MHVYIFAPREKSFFSHMTKEHRAKAQDDDDDEKETAATTTSLPNGPGY